MNLTRKLIKLREHISKVKRKNYQPYIHSVSADDEYGLIQLQFWSDRRILNALNITIYVWKPSTHL
jgi:hypothetical protein